ncbi:MULTISPECIES: Zn-ribbon domain-containing OB-fold protein [unclassified Streptomyces]|uniref:Zn-ribbon domain-containing OB-fold protein n=1 Tax=unclassified Streptomyces TaxID=2593676 RepID=UPI0032473DB9
MTAPSQGYADGLAAGELRFQHCADCRRGRLLPARPVPALRLRVPCVAGEFRPGHRLRDDRLHKRGSDPYNVALIDLDEGFRMMSRVEVVAAEDVAIGSRVGVTVITEDDAPLAVFRPLEVRA